MWRKRQAEYRRQGIVSSHGPCKHTYAVQVKTNGRNDRFWLVGEKTLTTAADTFIYVLVNLTKHGPDFNGRARFRQGLL